VRCIRQQNGTKKGHPEEEGFYTVREVASRIGLSETTIVKWCKEGILNCIG
jgi:hypothetical protein